MVEIKEIKEGVQQKRLEREAYIRKIRKDVEKKREEIKNYFKKHASKEK